MKDSLIVLGIFVGGCLLGVLGYFPLDLKTGNLSIYILYALMFQIGISIGSNKELKSMISQLRLKFLLIPLATISGTLLFSAIASLLLSRWSIFDCMAVGSGFAYYSLSSVLTPHRHPAILAFFQSALPDKTQLTNVPPTDKNAA